MVIDRAADASEGLGKFLGKKIDSVRPARQEREARFSSNDFLSVEKLKLFVEPANGGNALESALGKFKSEGGNVEGTIFLIGEPGASIKRSRKLRLINNRAGCVVQGVHTRSH